MLSVDYHKLSGLNVIPQPRILFEELALLVYGRQADFLTHFFVTNLDELCLHAFHDLRLQLSDDVLVPGKDTLGDVDFEGLLTKDIAPLAFLPEFILGFGELLEVRNRVVLPPEPTVHMGQSRARAPGSGRGLPPLLARIRRGCTIILAFPKLCPSCRCCLRMASTTLGP